MELRVARHTNDLEPLIIFYSQLFDLRVLGSFQDHDGYDGVFLGKEGMNWHLEFTKSHGLVEFHFGEDDLLVFYPKSVEEYQQIMQNLKLHQLSLLSPKNPYWEHNGIMVEDPDGYKIIVSDMRVLK